MNPPADPALVELRTLLAQRLEELAGKLSPPGFRGWLEPLMQEVLAQGFAEAGADEGTVWLVDSSGEYLVPAYNTGPNAARMEAKFRQPLNAGLICMVFASEQPFVEKEVHRNTQRSPLLDNLLQVQTYALIAVPFSFLGRCRGVVSCVQLLPADRGQSDPPGFGANHLAAVQRTTGVLGRLIEHRLLSSALELPAT